MHAHTGIDGGIDFVMVCAGVHYQYLRTFVSLFHHVWQVVAIFLGQSCAQDNEVECIALESVLHATPMESDGDMMTSLGHLGGLRG